MCDLNSRGLKFTLNFQLQQIVINITKVYIPSHPSIDSNVLKFSVWLLFSPIRGVVEILEFEAETVKETE